MESSSNVWGRLIPVCTNHTESTLNQVFKLNKSVITIGSSSTNDISLKCSMLSSKHCKLVCNHINNNNKDLIIVFIDGYIDTSTHGIWVDNKKISKKTVLIDGCEIMLVPRSEHWVHEKVSYIFHLEHKNEQRYNDYHSQVLPELVRNTNENIEQRVSKIIDIINEHKEISSLSNEFSVPSNFLPKIKKQIEPEIHNWSKVDVSLCKIPPTDKKKYKSIARDRIHKKKLPFYGDYVFAPIIYDYLYKYISDNVLSLTGQMNVFIDIIIAISESRIGSNSLIPYSLYQTDTKFRKSAMFLLQYFDSNMGSTSPVETAKDAFKNFIKKLKCIQTQMALNKSTCHGSLREIKTYLTHINEIYGETSHKKKSNKMTDIKDKEPHSQSAKQSKTHKKYTNNVYIFLLIGIIFIFLLIRNNFRNNIYIFLSIGIIFIFLLIHHFVKISQPPLNLVNGQSNEEKCLNLLQKYELKHIWPKLIEEGFDDMSLWKSITSDMLDNMQITNADKIRFDRLKHSQYSRIEKLMNFCKKNQKLLSVVTGAIGAFPFMYWYKKFIAINYN